MDYQFVELQQLGWNAMTVEFAGTVFFGAIQAWGLVEQVRKIRSLGSGKSIPALLNAFMPAEAFAFSLYGYRTHHLAMVLNGLLGFFYLAVYFTATQYADNDGKRWWHLPLVLLIPAMWFFPYEGLMTAIIFLALCTIAQWPIELRREGIGALEIKMVWVVLASITFWTAYFAAVSHWMLFWANLAAVVIVIITIRMWYRYRAHPVPLAA